MKSTPKSGSFKVKSTCSKDLLLFDAAGPTFASNESVTGTRNLGWGEVEILEIEVPRDVGGSICHLLHNLNLPESTNKL